MKRIFVLVMVFMMAFICTAFASHWSYAWNDECTTVCIDTDSIDVLANPNRVIYTGRAEFIKDVSSIYINAIGIPDKSKIKDFSYLLSKNEITIDDNGHGYIKELEDTYYNADGTIIYTRKFDKNKEIVVSNTYSGKIYKLVMDYVSNHQEEILNK